jgi:hypothetical protein
MTHDIDASIIFFLVFFAGLAVLLTGLYLLEASLDENRDRSRARRSRSPRPAARGAAAAAASRRAVN